MDNLGKNKTYNMREVVFVYLKEKCHRKDYEGITYDQISQEVDSKLRASFDESCNTFSNNFRDLLTNLKIKDEIESLKKQNGGYSFDEEEKDFLCELMFRYTYKKDERNKNQKDDKQVQIWKAIRNIDNEDYNGFVNIYILQIGSAIIDEVEFLRNGFLNMYKKYVGEESNDAIDFERHLDVSIQYVRLLWIRKVDEILGTALPISWKEIGKTLGEELLIAYDLRLFHTIAMLEKVILFENIIWAMDKERRINRAEKVHGLEQMQELEDELERIINLIEKSSDDIVDENKDSKTLNREKKKQYNRKRKEIKKEFDKLPLSEKECLDILSGNLEGSYETKRIDELMEIITNLEF